MFRFKINHHFYKTIKAIFYGLIVFLFVSCASDKGPTNDVQKKYNKALSSHFSEFIGNDTSDTLQSGKSRGKALSGPIAVIGTGKFIEINEIDDLDEFDLSKLSGNPNDGVVLNFTNVPIKDAARAILGEILDLNYSIDPQITGTINFKTSKPVRRAQLLGLFQDLLSRQRLVLSENGDIFHITTVQNAMKSQGKLPPGTKKINDATISPIPLQHVSATQLASVLSPLVSQYASLQADAGRNMLLVKSDTEHLPTIYELIQIFDVDWMAGLSFAMYPLSQTTPANMIKDLKGIFQNDAKGIMSDIIDFMPIDRLNAVLVVTKNPRYLVNVAKWIEQLDRGEEGSMGLYVYKLTHTKADMITDVLGNIFGATNLPSTKKASKPSAKSKDSSSSSKSTNSNSNTPDNNENPQSSQKSIQAGNINIYPDVRNNSVVVRASPADYKMVEVALRKLDVPPLQVMIEATIAQVTLGDSFELGLQWFFGKQAKTGKANLGSLQSNSSGITSAAANTFSYIFTKNNLGATLTALQTLTDVKVVSSPHVMVLNNESASLNTGTEVPIVKQITTSITTDGAPTSTDIEYRKLGVNLNVTPHITGNDMVNLKINQSINSVLDAGTGNTPTLQNQSVDTMVSLKSGETVALGGLISDNETKAKGGVPYLRDVPLVGNLFSQQKNSKQRQELLILITPHVIKSTQQANLVTNELKYRMATATVFAQDENKIYTQNNGRVKVGLIDGPQPRTNPALHVNESSAFDSGETPSSPKNKVNKSGYSHNHKHSHQKSIQKTHPHKPTKLYPVSQSSKTISSKQVTQTASMNDTKIMPSAKKASTHNIVSRPASSKPPMIIRGSGQEYVQLSAMKDNRAALNEWKRVKSQYPNTLGKLSPVIKEYSTDSGNTYYRLQAGPISKSDASQLCTYLKSKNQACIVIN